MGIFEKDKEAESAAEMEVEQGMAASKSEGVQVTQEVRKEDSQEEEAEEGLAVKPAKKGKDVAPEVEEMEEAGEQVTDPTEEQTHGTDEMEEEKIDEEVEMEKDPGTEEQGSKKKKEAEEQVAVPAKKQKRQRPQKWRRGRR